MQAQGFDAWWPSDKLAVRGYVEVLPHLRELLAVRRTLGDRLVAQPPRVFIGVDAPDFNLDLEARLRAAGVPTVHFVSPSFWAWRAKKVEKLKRAADHVLCIFPFEPALLQAHGVASTYVGHPLAPLIPMDPDRDAARAVLGIADAGRVVALLPGSRRSEIDQLLQRFLRAAALMRERDSALRFVLPAVPVLHAEIVRTVERAGLSQVVQVTRGGSHTALAACDATLIASGTATLEAALFKRPMVIAYHMNWLSWQMMKRKMLQPWVGLPNILSREFVVPELLQSAATPQALANATLAWLQDDAAARARRAALHDRFVQLHRDLNRDTTTLAIDAIEKVLAR